MKPTLDEFDRRNSPPPDATIRAVAELLQRAGVDPDDVGRVEKVRLSEWQTAINADGEPEILDLRGASVVLTPSWAEGPRWPVVQPAAPVKVTFSGRVGRVGPPDGGHVRAVILPDTQIGYRLDHRGELEAFHDEAALAAGVALCRLVKPHRIVILGDLLDLPAHGKFRQEPSFAITTQRAIDRAHEWLVALAKIAPIDLLEGNHDARLSRSIADNALASFGLKQANTPESWPSLSVPHLLRIGSDLPNVNYVGGYPVGIVWLAPNLAAIHGVKLKLGQTLEDAPGASVIQGHTHKASFVYRQRRTFDGPAMSWAASPGCLCRTDGAVPGVNAALDERTGRSIARPQDWHQGCGVVTYREDGTTMPQWEFVPIEHGTARWRDHTIGATG